MTHPTTTLPAKPAPAPADAAPRPHIAISREPDLEPAAPLKGLPVGPSSQTFNVRIVVESDAVDLGDGAVVASAGELHAAEPVVWVAAAEGESVCLNEAHARALVQFLNEWLTLLEAAPRA